MIEDIFFAVLPSLPIAIAIVAHALIVRGK
jgi:hypothetical protein